MEAMVNPHSAAELAALSTRVHNVLGWLMLLIAIVLFVEARRGIPSGGVRYLWPGLTMLAGYGLTGFVFVHFRGTHKVSPFSDPVQTQHVLIGIAAALGGTVELLRRWRAPTSAWDVAWPLALVVIGVLFLLHEQGSAEALLVHWALAGTLIVAGLAMVAPVLAGESGGSTRVFGLLVLLGAATQLIFYQEKPGAHGAHGAHGSTSATTPPPAPAHDGHQGGHAE